MAVAATEVVVDAIVVVLEDRLVHDRDRPVAGALVHDLGRVWEATVAPVIDLPVGELHHLRCRDGEVAWDADLDGDREPQLDDLVVVTRVARDLGPVHVHVAGALAQASGAAVDLAARIAVATAARAAR